MTSNFLSEDILKDLIRERLDIFYNKRISKLNGLTLNFLVIRKNPYLLRATGVDTVSELITDMMLSYLIKSDETIFGGDFFEEIAKFVGNAEQADELGMDIVIETVDTYTVAEIKSGSNWKNARMNRGLKTDFDNAYSKFLERGLDKDFRAILGQSVGSINRDENISKYESIIRSGQAFWAEITGDADFYLKLIRYMGDYPLKHRVDYLERWQLAHNRLIKQFSDRYIDLEGRIDWEGFVESSSGDRRD